MKNNHASSLLWWVELLISVFLISSQEVISTNKCCPENHVLNSDLSDCVPYSSNTSSMEFHGLRLQYKGSFSPSLLPLLSRCPIKKRFEYAILNYNRHKDVIVLKEPDGFEGFKKTEMDGSEGSVCVDVVLGYMNELEVLRPFLYSCSNVGVEYQGSIQKCCSIGYVVDTMYGTCVKGQQGLKYFRLPNRLVKHKGSGSSTQSYSINVLESKSRGSCQFKSSIKEVYLHGRIVFEDEEKDSEYSCIDYDSKNELMALVCNVKSSPDCSRGNICIPKCCELNEVFYSSNSRCMKVTNTSLLYKPEFYKATGVAGEREVQIQAPPTHMIHYKEFHMETLIKRECGGNLYKVNDNENIYLLEDGSLYHEGYGISSAGFCVDNFIKSIDSQSPPRFSAVKCVELESGKYSNSSNTASESFNNSISICESKMADFNAYLRIVYTACGAFSLLFLIITFLLYSILPNFRNLHGKIVMSNISAIFLTTLFLIIAYNSNRSDKFWCIWTGYSLYYSGLAMFFWMSVMCFDLCWTFVRAKIPRKGSDRLKFAIYSIIAWTIPVTLWKSQRYSKKIGLTKSSGHGRKPNSESLHYSSKIKSNQRQDSERGGGRLSHTNIEIREQLILFTKLFLIMGLTWISECIHVEIHEDHQDLEDCNFYLEVFLRIIGGLNVLRGFGFFVIFICKRSIYNSFTKKYPQIIRIFTCQLYSNNPIPHRQSFSPRIEEDRVSRKHELYDETEFINVNDKKKYQNNYK
ncbi:MTH [Lepeophtheirus salmonis]|uniref:MTH n=1 Tax=Lepeophtheirus salmonis TaxID=72036 RepID=A0A7R8CQ66_LEPSM|nr:MTH [Lepeophtheirus salmonis]CAF2889995.1 MTH [Lepeophtheirus salmonis]